MGSFYRITIYCEIEQWEKIEVVLGPSNEERGRSWSLTIEEGTPKFNGALSFFNDLIETHLPQLNEIGITGNEISFWYIYAYQDQCNMEFSPKIMKRMGDLGITLCVSCWEK